MTPEEKLKKKKEKDSRKAAPSPAAPSPAAPSPAAGALRPTQVLSTINRNPAALLNPVTGPVAEAFSNMRGNITLREAGEFLADKGGKLAKGVASEFGVPIAADPSNPFLRRQVAAPSPAAPSPAAPSPAAPSPAAPPPAVPPPAATPLRDGSRLLDASTVDTRRFNPDGTANNGIGVPGGRQSTVIGPNDPLRQQGGVTGQFRPTALERRGSSFSNTLRRPFQGTPAELSGDEQLFNAQRGISATPQTAASRDLFTINRRGPLAGLPAGRITNETIGALADSKRAEGGAVGGSNVLRQISAINQRAERAFNQARREGTSIGGAERIANVIRAQGEQLINADRNTVVRESTASGERTSAETNARALAEAGLREQGALIAAEQTRKAETAAAQVEGNFVRNVLDKKGQPTGHQFVDEQLKSEVLGQVNLNNLSERTAGNIQAVLNSGRNYKVLLDNVNALPSNAGKRVDNLDQLLQGSTIVVNDETIGLMDFIRNPNIGITDLFDTKITLPDKTQAPFDDIFTPEVRLTADQRKKLLSKEK